MATEFGDFGVSANRNSRSQQRSMVHEGMIEMSVETEMLIKAKASRVGLTPEQIVRAALSGSGEVLPWRSPFRPRPSAATKEQLITAMEEISARCAAQPLVDIRSADKIIGYDDFGLPR